MLDSSDNSDFFARNETNNENADRKQYFYDLKTVLETKAGRNVFWHLLNKLGLISATFCGENTHQSSFLQGKSSAAQDILSDILSVDQAVYLQLLAERLASEHPNKENNHEN